ncbi:MAG: 3-oxoacyl-[acyl-carrier-protein] reductase [Dehalococcoidia bacterium]
MESRELEGKVALVTGSSRGLGKAIAVKLGSLGSSVAVNYHSGREKAGETADEIRNVGGRSMLLKADVADSGEVKSMIREVVKEWGRVDILVNNAGIVKDNLLPRMPDSAWDEVINTNLRGPYLCTKFALRTMMEQSWGRIINIASLAGIVGNQGQTNYSAAKGGLIAFTRSTAKEVGSRNITVNAIAPGFIVSDMTDNLSDELKSAILNRIPLGRFGRAEDIAELAAFLSSERAGYITAQVISVDGGVI